MSEYPAHWTDMRAIDYALELGLKEGKLWEAVSFLTNYRYAGDPEKLSRSHPGWVSYANGEDNAPGKAA